MDDLQFLPVVDDESLLECVENFDKLYEESPNFDLFDINPSTTNVNIQVPVPPDQSRFPVYSEQDINDLKGNASNKNTERSTKQWLSVFNNWRACRNLNINIVNMAPEDLDKVLGQFYAEIKKKDGDDYEPECLKIMQSAIERHLKENKYPVSIVRGREFDNSQKILNAKAMALRKQGKGKRPNKSQPLSTDELSALWSKGVLGDFNGKVLTNTNFKILTEQLGLRGRQDHYDAYVEDFTIITHQDGSESVEFAENPTKTRSGGLNIKRRTSKQVMYSTDGGEQDPVRLFKLWLSKRPVGMKDNGPLYLGIINRPKSTDTWYSKVRMGQNTIGKIMKTMAASLDTNKKITNHSMRKTLVSKLKNAGQPRHIIKEITGHAREASIDDYDEVDDIQRKKISHIISGYNHDNNNDNNNNEKCEGRSPLQVIQPQNTVARISTSSSSVPAMTVFPNLQLNQFNPYNMMFNPAQAMGPMWYNPMICDKNRSIQPPNSSRDQGRQEVNMSSCTINNYYNSNETPNDQPKKRRRAYILDSDDEE